MSNSQAWKSAERQAAKALGGERNKRGRDFSESLPDVAHPLFTIECKYRKNLPKLLTEGLRQAKAYASTKPPLLVVKERNMKGCLVVMHLSDFQDLLGNLQPTELELTNVREL